MGKAHFGWVTYIFSYIYWYIYWGSGLRKIVTGFWMEGGLSLLYVAHEMTRRWKRKKQKYNVVREGSIQSSRYTKLSGVDTEPVHQHL